MINMSVVFPTIIIEVFKHQGVNKASIRAQHKVKFVEFEGSIGCDDSVIIDYAAENNRIHPDLVEWASSQGYFWEWYVTYELLWLNKGQP